jgi:lysophospholipase L1-like esterase
MKTERSMQNRLRRRATCLLITLMTAACGGVALDPGHVPAPSLVAVGASDVVGIGANRPDHEGWAPVLASLMPEGTRFRKVGVSGWQAHQVRDFGLPDVLHAQPDTVVLWVGVNDFLAGKPLPRFEQELAAILGELAATEARVVVLNLPDLDGLPAFRSQTSRIRRELPNWQRTVAEQCRRHGAQVIDLAAVSGEVAAHPEYLSSDGFHPSTVGYRRLAEIIFAALSGT